jgi:hypothetical protein
MLSNNSSDFELLVRQQPKRARVAGGKEKGMFIFILILIFIIIPPAPLPGVVN